MEVEPDLADRHDPAFAREAANLVPRALVGQPGLVRMDARRDRQPVALGHAQRARERLALVHFTDDQHLREPGRARPRNHLVTIGVELRHVDVAVGVD